MKVGETKKITVSPEDGYGPEWTEPKEQTVNKKIFDDILVQTVPKSQTLDIVKMDIPISDYKKSGAELPKVGEVLSNEK
jgi:FKBP-type peptidyl-prolyl cis-trans isomerase 2